jgi:hypothetical protein
VFQDHQFGINAMASNLSFSDRNAPSAIIYDALVKAAQQRRLTSTEIRIKRLTAPLPPWREAGICRTTWYRRRARDLALDAAAP